MFAFFGENKILPILFSQYFHFYKNLETSRGAGVQVCDCKNEWLWVRPPLEFERGNENII